MQPSDSCALRAHAQLWLPSNQSVFKHSECRILASAIPSPSNHSGAMEVSEANSPTEEEEEEEEEGEERTSEPRPHTRSNPEGAEDRALGAQANVGSRSEGEGEAASADDGVPSAPGAGPKPWQVPAPAPEVQIRTPRVNCPEKVVCRVLG